MTRNILKSALTGAFAFISADVSLAADYKDTEEESLVYQDTDIKIISSGDKREMHRNGIGANSFITICPADNALSDAFVTANKPVAVLYSTPLDKTDELIYEAKAMPASLKGKNIPSINFALIEKGGVVEPAYTFNESASLLQQRAEGRIAVEGTSPTDTNLVANIKRHVRDFCFSNF